MEQLAAGGAGKNLPGPRATLFIAPAQIKKRTTEWGAEAFGRRMVAAWEAFLAQVANPQSPWLRAEHHTGGAAALAAYTAVQGGKNDPRVGVTIAMSDR